MPGRNASEADSNFALYFRESLSVITNSFLLGYTEGNRSLLTYREPVKLTRKSGDPLYVNVTQTYLIVQSGDGEYKANSTAYIYTVLGKFGNNLSEILEFHWHPTDTPKLKWPHLHVNGNTADGDVSRVHFPTGRLAVEDFIRILVRDFDVKMWLPYDEAKRILTKNKRAFASTRAGFTGNP